MDLDALVWLIAGVGLGLGLSLLLLLAYAGLEGGRLRRRLRSQRSAPVPTAEPALEAKPAEPPLVPERPPASVPVVAAEAQATPEGPAEVVGVDDPASMEATAEEAGPETPAEVDHPAPAALPRKPQSVEEIFAEAFADDRYVTPRPPGPGAEKG